MTWPALKASCEPHTVAVGGSRVSGFLVRSTRSRQTLGWVWRVGDFTWAWRTDDDQHFGERASQRAAVEVLRDYADLGVAPVGTLPRAVRLPLEDAVERVLEGVVVDELPERMPKPKPPSRRGTSVEPPPRRAQPKPEPAKPPQRVVWGTSPPDLTEAVAEALKRRKGGA